jgi:hypothetical protein
MRTSSKRVLIGALALALAALGARPALAEKLVIFKNGKALRVKSIKEDGKWLRLEFDGKDFLAVPFSGVASIEDSISNAGVSEMKLNQVAAGSGGAVGGGGYVPPQRTEDPGLPPDVAAGQEQIDQEDAQSAIAEEMAAKQNNQVNGYVAPGLAIGNRRGRALAQQQQQLQPGAIPGIPGGLQPIGTQVGSPLNNSRNPANRNRGLNQGRPSN